MLLISYRGVWDGQNFEDANTPKQIGQAFNAGYSCMVDAWRVADKIYLGNDQPITEVTPIYLKSNRFYINARNTDMLTWLQSQPPKFYPNYFYFPGLTPTVVTASNGKLITPGTVAVNNTSVMFLPEIDDKALFSMVNIRSFGIITSYCSFVKRMRNEGVYY
jgi:hypothetical protein